MQNNNTNNLESEEDVSMYYPDGDSEHMADDDAGVTADDSAMKKRKAKLKKRNSRMTKSQIAIIAVIFLLYTVVLLTAAWFIFYRPSGSKDATVPFDIEENIQEEESVSSDVPPLDAESTSDTSEVTKDSEASFLENLDEATDEESSDKKSASSEYVAKDGVYNILVVGHDDAAYLADVTMIVNFDTVQHKISIVQIPRDTLVSIGVLTNKINAAFSTFFSAAYNSGEKDYWNATMENYARMLEKSLCINIHHTVVMGLSGFRYIVDALDGVDVYVPQYMYYSDPEQDLYIDIPAGWQHLNGYNAECFVRYRSGYLQADLGRVNAQKIFLTAMFNKVKATVKAVDISTLSNVAQIVFDCVNTDMSVSDILYYAKELINVDLESINMTTIPGNTAGQYYVINRKATLDIVNEYLNIYEKEISDSIFDRNLVFCMSEYQYICDVYYAAESNSITQVYNAEEIDEDSIYIPGT